MKTSQSKPSAISERRCAREFVGRRCAEFARIGSEFCFRHKTLDDERREAADVSATLTEGLKNLKTLEDINQFLSRLLLLQAQDRISPRRAEVLVDTANQLLRTIKAMQAQKENPANIEYIIGVPRPDYARPKYSPEEVLAKIESASDPA